MKKSFLLFLVVAFFCIACGSGAPTGELTRDLAKDILVKRGGYNGVCVETIWSGRLGPFDLNPITRDYIMKLKDAGYISIPAVGKDGWMDVKKSKKLEPFVIKGPQSLGSKEFIEVKLGDLIIDEITGISDAPMMGTNIKAVEYTAHVEPNELAKRIKPTDSRCVFNRKEKFTILFQKYDDGWRVTKQ
jgi:hypothetical protein